jgi:hypothetical protein
MSMLGKTLLAGVAVAAGVVLVRKRGTVKGLLPGRSSSEPAPAPPPPAQSPPPISNYDAAGPVENTSTPVPTPPPFQPPAIDEAAEEAAAAAEAANIGGTVSDYAGLEPGETADESLRPLMEAGEGEAEGQEQAEAELAAAAEPTAPGESPEQHQIEDVLESQPTEQIEPLVSETPEQPDEGGSEWRTWSGRSINP